MQSRGRRIVVKTVAATTALFHGNLHKARFLDAYYPRRTHGAGQLQGGEVFSMFAMHAQTVWRRAAKFPARRGAEFFLAVNGPLITHRDGARGGRQVPAAG